jgi:hypothetical protein
VSVGQFDRLFEFKLRHVVAIGDPIALVRAQYSAVEQGDAVPLLSQVTRYAGSEPASGVFAPSLNTAIA